MQKFFTIFASPEVKNRSNTSHYVFSKPKMDKKQKKSLRRHLLVIYIFYFLALAAGFIHSFVPHVSSSLATGWQAASEDIRMQEKHGIAQHTYFLAARLQNDQSNEILFPIETGHASISTEAEYTGVNIYVKTDENSDPTVVRALNKINYTLLLFIPALLAKLSILILVALIINILRKSVRDEQPLPGRIIIYTRAVGFLLILAEVCAGFGVYIYHEGSPLQVAASFPLNYWNIVMAILVLFSAEVFSIGSRLSEEQKLTI